MSSIRGGFGSAFALLLAVVGIAAVLVLVSPALNGSGSRALPGGLGGQFASGGSMPLSPRSLDVQPREITPVSVTTEGTGTTGGSPGPTSQSGGPGPTDPPFGTEVRVTSDPDAQTHPSIASEPGGSVLYAVYTDQAGATTDVFLSRSTDGGVTWTSVGVATSGSYNEFEPRVVVHGSRVFVFFSSDDPGLLRGFHYAVSTNQGLSWTVSAVNYGATAPFRDLRTPDASSYNSQWLYATYDSNCDMGSPGAAPCFDSAPSYTPITVLFDSAGMLVNPTIYFPFAVDVVEPSIIAKAGQTLFVGDIDSADPAIGGPPGSHTVIWAQTPTGQNTAASWSQALFNPNFSMDVVRVDASGFGQTVLMAYQYIDPAGGIPDHVIASLSSKDDGATFTFGPLAAVSGQQEKDPATFAAGGILQATFFNGADLGYATSSNGGDTWSSIAKVNSNVGSAFDAVRSSDIVVDSSLGAMVGWQDSRDGNPNIYFTMFQRYSITIATNPPSLRVRFDTGAFQPAPETQPLVAGSSHAIEAQSPQSAGAGVQYVFVQWSDGSTANPRTITVTADITYTANMVKQYQITVDSIPGGRTVSVNGASQTAPYNFWCNDTATAALDAPSPQTVSPTSQYRFAAWSDALGQAHQITCNNVLTVTATFILQFQLTVATSPSGREVLVGGAPQTGPYVFYCDNASSVSLNVVSPQASGPGTRYRYDAWSDGGAQSHQIACTGSATVTASFVLQYQVTIGSTPSGRAVTVNGVPQTTPFPDYYDVNAQIGLLVPSPQSLSTTTRYSFSAWNDGNPNPSRIIVVDSVKTFTALFTTEYYLTISSSPSGGGFTVNPGSGWHPDGDFVAISTNKPNDGSTDRYRFGKWDGDFVSYSSSANLLIDRPIAITAIWVHQFKIDIQTNVPGRTISVDIDGTPTLVSAGGVSLWWNETTSHTVSSEPTVSVSGTERWAFSSWTGGGSNPYTISATSAGAYTATYTHQYLITLTVSPTSGPTVTVDNQAYVPGTPLWWDDASSHTLNAVATQNGATGTRYVFAGWETAGVPSLRTYTVSSSAALTATFTTQYLLTITSQYGDPVCQGAAETVSGGCWYVAGTSATVTVTTPVQAGGAKRAFTGWSVNGTGSGSAPTLQVSMTGPKTAEAGWRDVAFVEEYGVALGTLIAVIVAVILILLVLMMRRRRQGPQAVPPPMAQAPPTLVQAPATPPPPAMQEATGTKTCASCGMEIPGGASTCPVCGSPV